MSVSAMVAGSMVLVMAGAGATGPAGSAVLYIVWSSAGLWYVRSMLSVAASGVSTASALDVAGCLATVLV